MNYFEIINAVLLELNYEQVSVFENLQKQEHKRIMNNINLLNKKICCLKDTFSFRQKLKEMTISSDNNSYPIRFSGKIHKIIGQNSEYCYENDYSKFFTNKKIKTNCYSVYDGKLLFPNVDDELKIFYSTNLFVKDVKNNYKSNFEEGSDISIIPENFTEKLFVNGVAYNFKQNTSHPKYLHWKQEYDNALKDLLIDSNNITGSTIFINGGFREI